MIAGTSIGAASGAVPAGSVVGDASASEIDIKVFPLTVTVMVPNAQDCNLTQAKSFA